MPSRLLKKSPMYPPVRLGFGPVPKRSVNKAFFSSLLEQPSRHLGGKTINRTSDTTVTFTRPFVIERFEQELPAGDYVIETEEELIEGLSFPAYRRVSTTLHVDRFPGRPGQKESWQIVPEALEAALIRDGVGTRASGIGLK